MNMPKVEIQTEVIKSYHFQFKAFNKYFSFTSKDVEVPKNLKMNNGKINSKTFLQLMNNYIHEIRFEHSRPDKKKIMLFYSEDKSAQVGGLMHFSFAVEANASLKALMEEYKNSNTPKDKSQVKSEIVQYLFNNEPNLNFDV